VHIAEVSYKCETKWILDAETAGCTTELTCSVDVILEVSGSQTLLV
jgi:hypothetical protein